MGGKKNKTVDLVNAIVAKRRAERALQEQQAQDLHAREVEAFRDIWNAFKEVANLPVCGYRAHSTAIEPLSAALIYQNALETPTNELSFWDCMGARGLTIAFRDDHYCWRSGLAAPVICSKEEALQKFLDYVADRVEGKNI